MPIIGRRIICGIFNCCLLREGENGRGGIKKGGGERGRKNREGEGVKWREKRSDKDTKINFYFILV